MNIFYLSSCPIESAKMMVDKHVLKMPLETCQLLSTAHRFLDGTEYIGKSASGRRARRWLLSDDREDVLYSATHINHPSAVWVRQSNNNYNWLFIHLSALLGEYTHRYGKRHKCTDLVEVLVNLPRNIPIGYFTPPTQAMPDDYKSADSVEAYRAYYREGKKALHTWKNREVPEWISC